LKRQAAKSKVKLTQARAAILQALHNYESKGEYCSLFVANKLAYFLQRLGETSMAKLRFEAGRYGPYSVGVGHLLHAVNGRFIKGLEQMDAKPFEHLELDYDRIKEVGEFVENNMTAEQRQKLDNLARLIDGFESAFSLELLASVDFVRRNNPRLTEAEIIETIQSWSERKSQLFKERYIRIAIKQLDSYAHSLPFS
jgi:hypothetical protein